jgi:conjugative relaxase-like TrwC/TraI family protein
MSLWKLRVGVESYYLAQVASGLDEYYTGAGEASGRWAGGGSELLGLVDEVTGDDLRAVLAGLAPATGLTPNGTQLTNHPRRVPGFDMTFSVPKSVSVVYALGDPLVQSAVVEACEAALAESLAWLEREACFVRRGTNNRKMAADPEGFGTRRMIAEGFVAAQFPHRTSRLADPHLHWHVLVANMARGIDGRWTALDGKALYASARTAGVLFQAAMRRELSQRLGVEWGPTHHDSAEIAGIPARVLREFSQRTEQIAEWMEHRGVEGLEAKNEALLETRPSKPTATDFASVEAEWRKRAEQLGWGPTELDQLLAASPRVAAVADRWVIPTDLWTAGGDGSAVRAVSFDEWVDWLVTTRVTEKSGTFTRFDLAQAVGSALPSDTGLATVEATANRALASPIIAQVGDHWTERRPVHAPDRTIADDRELLYTSRSLLAVERRLLEQLAAGAQTGTGVLEPVAVDTAIEHSTLGDDQATAIRALTSNGDRISVMVGRAGTGKTHTLGTLRAAYEDAGWLVIGLAPSARAARELQEGSGIESTTIARHLVEQRTITTSTVVVVDEAAMAGTRDVAAIVDQATAVGAKVVLVGDHHQLPEVAAGGAFRAALDTLGDQVVELTVNRRQQHEWEREALDQLRCGDVPTAFAAYRDQGRVVITDTPDDLHAIVLGDWHAIRPHGATLLLAGTRAEARFLNRHARQLLAASGELSLDNDVEFAGHGFVVGDEVVMCRNDRHQHLVTGEEFAVDNGMRGTVVGLSLDHMTVRVTSGEHVVLDRDYLDQGWVDHAYAVTIHKAQGVTCDSVLVVGPAGLYREGAYVALSRARHEARLYVTADQAAGIEERHEYGIPLPTESVLDPEADILARLHRSAAKNLVIVDDPDADRIAELVATVPAPELLRRARHAYDAEQNCGAVDPAEMRAELDAAIATRAHIDVGRRVRAIDRDNVGHVLSIDDDAGACLVQFDSIDGRTAIKTLDWSQLVVIDHPDTIEIPPAAAATLARRTEAVVAAETQWSTALGEHSVRPGDATRYRRAIHTAADDAARALEADPPEWLTTWLGSRPAAPASSSVWDDAVMRIAHHRLLHDITQDEPGIGTRPADPIESDRWQDLKVRLLEDRLWLADHPTPEIVPLPTATPHELVDRRAELERLLATAPADQQQFIDRIIRSELDPTEMHEYLSAAMAVQDDRRDWILTNWPHLVELEQVTALIAEQEPLAHWPVTQPAEVRDVLDQLRRLAPQLDAREERSLAELDRLEIESDPVRKLEARRTHLRQIAEQATPIVQEAIDNELATLSRDLRAARRSRTLNAAFDRYGPNPVDDARATRIATLAYDTLTNQPGWLVDEIRNLHEKGQLNTRDVAALATRITHAVVHQDRHGHLPEQWTDLSPSGPEPPAPSIDVGR